VECVRYGEREVKTVKTFLATWRPAGGLIRVVIVREGDGWLAYLCTDPGATAAAILEVMADRGAIEQSFKDVKEVWGAGQQQVRNVYADVGPSRSTGCCTARWRRGRGRAPRRGW
jgi:hypothetical protein